MKLKDAKIKVRNILEKYPNARNNDWTMMAWYIYDYRYDLVRPDKDNESCILLKSLKELPPFETLRRCRQIIQNVNGEFLPTDPKITKARRIKEKNYRDAEVREAK